MSGKKKQGQSKTRKQVEEETEKIGLKRRMPTIKRSGETECKQLQKE